MRLLLDAMYARGIAEGLRARGHDVAAASERDDLRALADPALFEATQAESRVIVTNNVSDFMPLVGQALQAGSTCHGVVFTSDRSLPRSKASIGTFVSLLDAFLAAHVADEALPTTVEWLTVLADSGGKRTSRRRLKASIDVSAGLS